MNGEYPMALSENGAGGEASFVSQRFRPAARSDILPSSRSATLPPGELELSDSDRPTEISYPPASAILGFDREHPTIPAPLWTEGESMVRPAPAVATHRGIFLENLASPTEPPPSFNELELSQLNDSIDFDSDDTL